jgi:hypothetical protein
MTNRPSSSPRHDLRDQGRSRNRWWRRRDRGALVDPDARAGQRASWWAVVLEWLGDLDWDFDD